MLGISHTELIWIARGRKTKVVCFHSGSGVAVVWQWCGSGVGYTWSHGPISHWTISCRAEEVFGAVDQDRVSSSRTQETPQRFGTHIGRSHLGSSASRDDRTFPKTSMHSAVLRTRMGAKTHPDQVLPKQSVVELNVVESSENASARKENYLVTLPHPVKALSEGGYKLRPPESLTRLETFLAYMDCCANPDYQDPKSIKNGCSVQMAMVGVFKELHDASEDGVQHGHTHLVVQGGMGGGFRFLPVKRALLKRHGLASHWSCSHEGHCLQ